MPSEKFDKRAKEIDSLVCVGLDSDFDKLPERFKKSLHPQFEFNKWIIDETHESAAAFKINAAFYEARGVEGMQDLKSTMDYLRGKHPGVFTIYDAKRADIGNTNSGYVTAAFDWLGFDAITLNPYLGGEALKPFLERTDKVSIILCRTSNPGAAEFQDLLVDSTPLWERVAQRVFGQWNTHQNCMLVVGATYPTEMKRVRSIVGDITLLVPGVGAQGGSVVEVLRAGRNAQGQGVIINSSRGVIFADSPRDEAERLRDDIRKC